MSQLVFFLEENSAKEFLKKFLPRLLPSDFSWRFVTHEGKSDLMRSLPRKLRAWREKDSTFIVLRDKDRGDCRIIKQELVEVCRRYSTNPYLVRIAVHEPESWYLGDLSAVDQVFLSSGRIKKKQNKAKFRDPDSLNNPVQILREITEDKYQKTIGSELLGSRLNTNYAENRSKSFQVFCSGLLTITK